MNKLKRSFITFASLALTLSGAVAQLGDSRDRPGTVQKMLVPEELIQPSPPLSPEESLESFKLAPGIKIELVAAEPLVKAPVAMKFDPQGRMWVVEMVGYMPDIDANGEDEPVGSVVTLEDTDGDGKMDKRTVFLDELVMPRAVSLVADGVLIGVPPTLTFYKDTDGDGRADESTIVDNRFGNQGNPEYGPNELIWTLDNWIYSSHHNKRYRYEGGEWITENTYNRGQWGLSQDDYGRLYYGNNSDQSRVDLMPSSYLERNPNFSNLAGLNFQTAATQEVWPERVNAGLNRAYQPGILRPGTWNLQSFTGACGPFVYRGDLLPEEFQGNIFVADAPANFIRRNVVTEQNGQVSVENAYSETEFLTSMDERFRPVHLNGGPDGALYVLDMYRGVIQHKTYVTSYLREQMIEREMEQPLDRGRIYRIVHDLSEERSIPKIDTDDLTGLVELLKSPNGWTRDTAQRLLVERQDKSVVPQLKQLAKSGSEDVTRLHALWTLEGLHSLDETDVLQALGDSHPQVRIAGLRLAESFFGSEEIHDQVFAMEKDPTFEVRWQLMLTLGKLKTPEALDAMVALLSGSDYDEFLRAAAASGLNAREVDFIAAAVENPNWNEQHEGQGEMVQMLAQAVSRSNNSGSDLNRIFQIASQVQNSQPWLTAALVETFSPNTGRRGRGPGRGAGFGRGRSGRGSNLTFDSEPAGLIAIVNGSNPELAEQAQTLVDSANWPGKELSTEETEPEEVVAPLTEEQQVRFEAGKELYTITCAACHQIHGNGMPGLAPPLRDSEWVTGSPDRLIRISLGGVTGPIMVKGEEYRLDMPGLPVFDDEQLASILTYLRREWDHGASPIEPEKVGEVRDATEDRLLPWTAEELLQIP